MSHRLRMCVVAGDLHHFRLLQCRFIVYRSSKAAHPRSLGDHALISTQPACPGELHLSHFCNLYISVTYTSLVATSYLLLVYQPS